MDMYIDKFVSESSPFHILTVDDESAHRHLVKDILDGPEFVVEEADCGAKALSMIKEGDFDVVLLDRRMPNMNGDEVCRQIRMLR